MLCICHVSFQAVTEIWTHIRQPVADKKKYKPEVLDNILSSSKCSYKVILSQRYYLVRK